MSLTLLGHVDLADGDGPQAQARLAEAAVLFQSTGNMVYLPWCLEGLAGVAAAPGGAPSSTGRARPARLSPPQIIAMAIGEPDAKPAEY